MANETGELNYLLQIRGFWRSHEENSFSTTEVALYMYLLQVCNICQWKNPFKRNNSKIQADLGISFNTLKNSRNKLAQSNLLIFKTQNGSPNVTYTLSKFDRVANEVFAKVGSQVGGTVGDVVLSAKDKLDLNKTIPPIPPPIEKKTDQFPTQDFDIELDDLETGKARILIEAVKKITLTDGELETQFRAFKILNFSGKKFYESRSDIFQHFQNWLKLQNFSNGNSPKQRVTGARHNPKTAGQEQLLAKLHGRFEDYANGAVID